MAGLKVLLEKQSVILTYSVPVVTMPSIFYVDNPYEVVKVVEVPGQDKISYVPRPYKTWQSVEEFKTWADRIEIISLRANNCVQVAQMLQQIALEDGYPVSEALVHGNLYDGVYVGGVTTGERDHDGLLVYIQGHHYYYEPLNKQITRIN